MADLSEVVSAARAALVGPCAVPPDTPLVAACSGGPDSVALVHVLAELTDAWPIAAVVFVDHGLRVAGVDEERAAARAAARAVGAPFLARRVEVAADGNLQASAREARYSALRAAAAGGAMVATAHHRGDHAETVLQRLVRGAGLRGLAAIPWREAGVVRPLLDVSRSALRALGPWPGAEDPTNDSDRFQRNRLRRHVLPLLREENPDVEGALARAAQQARDGIDLLDALLAALAPSEADLRGMDPGLVATWVRWRLDRDAAAHQRPSRAAVAALVERLVAGADGTVSLGGGLAGHAEAGRLRLAAEADPRGVLVAPATGSYRRADTVLAVGVDPDPEPALQHVATTWIEPDDLVWPLRLQLRRAGQGYALRDGAGRLLWAPGEPAASPAGAGTAVRIFRRGHGGKPREVVT